MYFAGTEPRKATNELMSPKRKRRRGIWQLLRPANIVTSLADVAAGLAVAGFYSSHDLPWWQAIALFVGTVGFYGGGVVLNDAFDARLDAVERPERPIPSGAVPRRDAYIIGFSMLAVGLVAAAAVSLTSFFTGAALTAMVVLYNAWAKRNMAGPLVMGSCRALNLLLGMSISAVAWQHYPLLPLVHLIYIAMVTSISRFEVKGGRSPVFWLALLVFIMVPSLVALFTNAAPETAMNVGTPLMTTVFIVLLMQAMIAVFRDSSPQNVRHLVKTGVLCIILLDAIIASRFTGLGNVLSILVLYPISRFVAKFASVT